MTEYENEYIFYHILHLLNNYQWNKNIFIIHPFYPEFGITFLNTAKF